jgi:hypothetical protein
MRGQLPLPYRNTLNDMACAMVKDGVKDGAKNAAKCGIRDPEKEMRDKPGRNAALLQGLETFSIEQDQHRAPTQSPCEIVARLYQDLHAYSPTIPAGYIAAALPQSPTADRLIGNLLKVQGIGMPAKNRAANLDDAARRHILSTLMRALLIAEPDTNAMQPGANAMQFNGFDFLESARLGLTTAAVTERFATALRARYHSSAFTIPIARWSAQIVLQTIHPALARTDTPSHIEFAGREYANLMYSIDFLGAQGIDHGHYSYLELQHFADRTIAGAKLNPGIAKDVQRLLAPAALWYAHGRQLIDLRDRKVSAVIVAYALHRFDQAQIQTWRETWQTLTTVIEALSTPPQPEQFIATRELVKHGLTPSDFAWSTRDYLFSSRECGAYQTFLELYLKSHCWGELKRHTGDGRIIPNLRLEVIPAQRAAERASHIEALTTLLEMAVNQTDAALQRKWNTAETFAVITPRLRGWITQEDDTLAENTHYANTGVIVELHRHGELHRFTVSVSAENIIAPARLLSDYMHEEPANDYVRFAEDVIGNAGKFLGRAALSCEKPCKESKFTWAERTTAEQFFRGQQAFAGRNQGIASAMLADCDASLPLPAEYAETAIRLNLSMTPFIASFAAAAPSQLKSELFSSGIKLAQQDDIAIRNTAAGADRARIVKKLLTTETPAYIGAEAGAATGAQMSNGRAGSLRPGAEKPVGLATAKTIMRMLTSSRATARIGHALKAILTPKIEHALAIPVRNPRILVDPYSRGLFGPRVKPPALPVIASRSVTVNGKQGWRFELPQSTTVRPFFDAQLQRQGIFSVYLNAQRYDANIYALRPVLVAVDNDGIPADASLCREERALRKIPSRRKNCEQTAQAGDGVDEGRAINHESVFIQEAPIAGRITQRPRRTVTTFFPDNQGNLAGSDIVIIDQIFFRPDIRAGQNDTLRTIQYNRLPASYIEHENIPPINRLPETLSAHLVDRGPGERPSIEYMLESDVRPMRPTASATGVPSRIPSRIRTRIQSDFHSLLSEDTVDQDGAVSGAVGGTDGVTQGLVEIEEGSFYRFTIPRNWNARTEIFLHRVSDAQTVHSFIAQPTVEHIVRSAHFDVDITKEHAAVVIEVIATCDATDSLIEALDKAHRNRIDQSNPELSVALIRYVERHGEGRIDSISDDVLRDLNAAVSEIAKSTQSRENFRDLLRDSYQASRTNIHFHEMFVPPRVSRDVVTDDTPDVFLAAEKRLRERLSLFSTCFTTLDFSGVWEAAQQFFTIGSAAAMSRTDYVQSRFQELLGTRNVAVAEVTLATGRTLYYFSVSGKKPVPHRQDHPDYIFVELLPAAASHSPFPHITNLDSSYKPHPREGDTERLIFSRMQIDFPDPASIANITLTSRYDFCHSCIVCCIKAAEHYRNATINFDHFPKTARSILKATRVPMQD